jgi:hypothetical protein
MNPLLVLEKGNGVRAVDVRIGLKSKINNYTNIEN